MHPDRLVVDGFEALAKTWSRRRAVPGWPGWSPAASSVDHVVLVKPHTYRDNEWGVR
jgi:hypothetical protein